MLPSYIKKKGARCSLATCALTCVPFARHLPPLALSRSGVTVVPGLTGPLSPPPRAPVVFLFVGYLLPRPSGFVNSHFTRASTPRPIFLPVPDAECPRGVPRPDSCLSLRNDTAAHRSRVVPVVTHHTYTRRMPIRTSRREKIESRDAKRGKVTEGCEDSPQF